MTSQERNQIDQKKGSADACVTGERVGLPGAQFAGQVEATGSGESSRGASADNDGDDVARDPGATIPQQVGCGPNVTDYPGLGDGTRN